MDAAEDWLDGLGKAPTRAYNAMIPDGMLLRLMAGPCWKRFRLRKRTPVIMRATRDGSRDRVCRPDA